MWIDDFFELMYSSDIKKIKKSYELKNKKIPNFLYKYKSIDDNGFTFDLLENDLIFLSNANNLNDLYEGEIFYDNEELFYNRFKTNGLPYFMKKTKFSHNQKEQIKNSKNPIKATKENDNKTFKTAKQLKEILMEKTKKSYQINKTTEKIKIKNINSVVKSIINSKIIIIGC